MKAVKPKLKLPLQQRQAKQQLAKPQSQLAAQGNGKNISLTLDSDLAVQQRVIDDSLSGQRLDNYLIKALKGVPKSYIYRIIRDGQVRINKKRTRVDARLQVNDVVRIPPVRVSAQSLLKAKQFIPQYEFKLLFEDETLLALDKPAGVAVHGGSGVSFGVIEQLRRSRPQLKYLELVHRLDRETSGILLVAKKRSALVELQRQFKQREVHKIYLALVVGRWKENNKVIDLPLYKYSVQTTDLTGKILQEKRVKVVDKFDANGQRALSLVKVQQYLTKQNATEFSLLQVKIKTGRTHQIRVHLQSQGCPILGDAKYGDFNINKYWQKYGLNRMFLHAWCLQFNHPLTKQEIKLESALPAELAKFIST